MNRSSSRASRAGEKEAQCVWQRRRGRESDCTERKREVAKASADRNQQTAYRLARAILAKDKLRQRYKVAVTLHTALDHRSRALSLFRSLWVHCRAGLTANGRALLPRPTRPGPRAQQRLPRSDFGSTPMRALAERLRAGFINLSKPTFRFPHRSASQKFTDLSPEHKTMG